MCPMASDLASRLRWAPVLPHVLWLRTSPPGCGGFRRCHVSYGSGLCLPAEVGSAAATCPTAPCGPRTSSIKKSLSVLPVQLGTHVPNARPQVSNAPDRACMTCGQAAQSMPARHAYMQLQCDYSTTPALWTTRLALLQCQVTRQHDVILLTECSVIGDKTRRAHVVEDIICYSETLEPYCIGFYLPVATCRALGLIVTARP
jgi:hypothetical protein